MHDSAARPRVPYLTYGRRPRELSRGLFICQLVGAEHGDTQQSVGTFDLTGTPGPDGGHWVCEGMNLRQTYRTWKVLEDLLDL